MRDGDVQPRRDFLADLARVVQRAGELRVLEDRHLVRFGHAADLERDEIGAFRDDARSLHLAGVVAQRDGVVSRVHGHDVGLRHVGHHAARRRAHAASCESASGPPDVLRSPSARPSPPASSCAAAGGGARTETARRRRQRAASSRRAPRGRPPRARPRGRSRLRASASRAPRSRRRTATAASPATTATTANLASAFKSSTSPLTLAMRPKPAMGFKREKFGVNACVLNDQPPSAIEPTIAATIVAAATGMQQLDAAAKSLEQRSRQAIRVEQRLARNLEPELEQTRQDLRRNEPPPPSSTAAPASTTAVIASSRERGTSPRVRASSRRLHSVARCGRVAVCRCLPWFVAPRRPASARASSASLRGTRRAACSDGRC